MVDEALAWACIAIGQQWAVTTETSTRFHRSVRVGRRYRVEARVIDHVDRVMRTAAQVLERRGERRVGSSAVFTTPRGVRATCSARAEILVHFGTSVDGA